MNELLYSAGVDTAKSRKVQEDESPGQDSKVPQIEHYLSPGGCYINIMTPLYYLVEPQLDIATSATARRSDRGADLKSTTTSTTQPSISMSFQISTTN